MTKAAICVRCSDILAPYAETTRGWRWCACGTTATRWRDPAAGRLDITSTLGVEYVRVLGLANPFLTAAVQGRPYGDREAIDEEWRLLHDRVCEDIPGNYLFSEGRRHCWAIVLRPGETGDVRYIEHNDVDFFRPPPAIAARSKTIQSTPGSSTDRAAPS